MNALKSIGTKIMTATIAMGLVAGAAFAATGSTVTVNVPQSFNVGSATLASGQYTITESSMPDGSAMFVFRSDKGESTVAPAMKSADAATDQKTSVVLSNDNGTLHLDKMFIAGESSGYQFANTK